MSTWGASISNIMFAIGTSMLKVHISTVILLIVICHNSIVSSSCCKLVSICNVHVCFCVTCRIISNMMLLGYKLVVHIGN